jgi:predicted nucleotidyltransferase
MVKLSKEQEILKILFKDFLVQYNSRSISKLAGISHSGAFKILKKLEKESVVLSKTIGKALIYSINFNNPIAKKEIEMILLLEAQGCRKWHEEFLEIAEKAKFAVLFGSIIKDEKQARDIDLLVVAEKNKFNDIERIIFKKNQILNKKVHLLLQSLDDFNKDTNSRNNAIIEIIKTGVVLFGQEEYVKIMEQVQK